MAASITEGSNSAAFSYDSEHARYKMVTAGVNAGTTYYLNGPGSALEEEAVVGGTTTWRDYIMADGKLTAERFCVGAAPCTASPTLTYFVLDHLGSVAVIVSSTGSVLNQLSYDAWGKRRNADGSAINCVAGTSPPSGVTRGFTGAEMIDGLCLVNLNARVYDPSLGRFMGADPTVGDYRIPQQLNRYTYVLDNPLSLTDPSGLCFLGCFWRDALFRDIFGLAVAVFLVQPELVALEGGVATSGELVLNAGIAGGVSGVISTGTLKGAALAALQGGLFAGAGNLTQGLKPTAGTFSIAYTSGELVSHGLIGGLTSELGGGRFGSGFLAGAISTFAPAPTPGQPIGETFEGTIISATLGGAGSVLGGGKFENGAVTGAFGYLFNACAHSRCWVSSSDSAAYRSGGPYGFWKSMCAGGDPFACSAMNVTANSPDNELKTLAQNWLTGAYQAAHATEYMAIPAGDLGMSIPVNGEMTESQISEYSNLLVHDYMDYLGTNQATAQWPSWRAINDIHWRVNQAFGLDPSGYAGTPLGRAAPDLMKTVICPACGP